MIFKTLNGDLTVFNKTLITTKDNLKALETVNATVYNKNGAFNLQGLVVNSSQSVSTFTKLNNAFKAYNGNLSKSTQLQNAYVQAVGKQNISLGNYLAGLNGAKASMGGYIKSLVVAKVASVGLQVASVALNAAISMGITLAISALVSAITKWINKEKEAREEAIETAKAAKEESNNLSELLNKYNQLSKEVKSNQGVKEDLLSVQSDLLEALGIEASQIDTLIEKYGDLNSAINQITLDSLRDAQGDLMVAIDAYEKDLIKIGKGYAHWYSLTDRNLLSAGKSSTDALDILERASIISSGSHGEGGGALILTGDDKTVEGILENYQKLKDAQEALNTAIDNGEITMEEMIKIPLYNDINSRLDELSDSIGNYNTAIADLNKNMAQQQILKSLAEQSSIPETKEEFEEFQQSMIDTAIASTKFKGSQDDIRDSIINVLSVMPEFEKYFEELNDVQGSTLHNETPVLSLEDAKKAVNGSDNVTGLIDELKLLQEVLSDTGNVSIETYEKLTAKSSKYSSALKVEAGRITVDEKKLKAINKTRTNAIKTEIKEVSILKKLQWIQEAKKLQQYKFQQNDLTDEIWNTCDSLQEEINQFDILAQGIDAASNAFANFTEAQDAAESGDYFDIGLDMADAFQKGLESGKIGTPEFLASMEGFMPEDLFAKIINMDDAKAQFKEFENVDNTSDANKPVSTAQQTAIDKKANIESPTLTGTPKAPTASADNDSTQIATTAFAQTAVNNHNTSSTAHSDIRNLISGLTTRLNALADSDDTTLDQLSEIVAYIKSNRGLIESVTTNKVNISDIIDNLTSTTTNKPLAASQGKVLKDLIDALSSAVDGKLPLTGGSMTGDIIFPNNKRIIQRQNATSNYTQIIEWYSGGVKPDKAHAPQIGQHNTGESIAIVPYATDVAPWDGTVGLFIKKGIAKLDGVKMMLTNKESLIEAINTLEASNGIPVDDDYLLLQYGQGETYFRKPVSVLWNYIKSKLATVAISGSYNDLKDKPTTLNSNNDCVIITDWNSAVHNGWYMASASALNSPVSNNWCFGLTISHNDNWKRQIVYSFGNSTEDVFSTHRYERVLANGTWKPWVKASYLCSTNNISVGIDATDTNAIGYVNKDVPISNTGNDGAIYKQVYSDNWMHEIFGDYRTGQIATRGKNAGTLQPWRIQLDSVNYSDYVPTKTGVGASGTWNISISGNAGYTERAKRIVDQLSIESLGSPTETRELTFGIESELYNSSRLVMKGTFGRIDFLFANHPSEPCFFGTKNFTDASVSLGRSDFKWKNIYAATSTITTSDKNEKRDIKDLDDGKTIDFIMGLEPKTFKFINGDSGRTHIGLIAQDVEELLESLNMSTLDFAGFIKSPKIRTVEKDGEFVDEVVEDEYTYGLRYEEFISPLIKMVQIQQEKINLADERLSILEKENAELKEKIGTIESTLKVIQNNLNL